jgi:hypothetical protein
MGAVGAAFGIVGIVLGTLGVMSAKQATDWLHYVHEHHCHVTEHRDPHVQGQNGWLCDDGQLHWPPLPPFVDLWR